jgi:hypothetical protein
MTLRREDWPTLSDDEFDFFVSEGIDPDADPQDAPDYHALAEEAELVARAAEFATRLYDAGHTVRLSHADGQDVIRPGSLAGAAPLDVLAELIGDYVVDGVEVWVTSRRSLAAFVVRQVEARDERPAGYLCPAAPPWAH